MTRLLSIILKIGITSFIAEILLMYLLIWFSDKTAQRLILIQ
jgi:hypothetical protein